MKIKLGLGVAGLAVSVLWLSGCATMSEDQCLAGDWGGKGYQDGANGYAQSRLDDHSKACAKVGVTPNVQAYFSAREQGLRTYCTWENGFRVGRNGELYQGVCSASEEGDFIPAYQDGRTIHAAEKAVSDVESQYRSALSRIRDREKKLDAKEQELRGEGLSREQRERIRERIHEVRGELRDARRDAEHYGHELRRAELEARHVIASIGSRYGVW